MSVLASERSESKAEFIMQARNLHLLAVHKVVKLVPKRYTFYIALPIANMTNAIYANVKRANSIYPSKLFEVELRRKYLLQANADVEALGSLIECAYELLRFPAEQLMELSEAIAKEQVLIKGVLKSDKDRYKNITG